MSSDNSSNNYVYDNNYIFDDNYSERYLDMKYMYNQKIFKLKRALAKTRKPIDNISIIPNI